jgi:hypothetical protein
MTKFYMRWKLNRMVIPTNPEERVKLWLMMLEQVKADLKSGAITDWGICIDLSAGYAFAETDEKTLHATILSGVLISISTSSQFCLLINLLQISNRLQRRRKSNLT